MGSKMRALQLQNFCSPTQKWLGRFFFYLLFYYSFLRLQFFLWNQESIAKFSDFSYFDIVLNGLRFDLAAIGFHLLPALLILLIPLPHFLKNLKTGLLFLLIFATILFLSLNVADIEYSNFAGRRLGPQDIKILQEAPAMATKYITTYWLLCVINIPILLWGGYDLLRRWQKTTSSMNSSSSLWLRGAQYFLMIGLIALALRGGWQPKPLTIAHSLRFNHGLLNTSVLNSTFTLLKTKSDRSFWNISFFQNEKDIQNLLQPPRGLSHLEGQRPTTPQNVVIFIFESFATEYNEFMPYLNSLKTKGISFPRALANGRRSIDAIPSVTAELPSLMDTAYVFSEYVNNDILSLPMVLKKRGYKSYFFHGGNNGTMHFDDYARQAQFDEYIGANEFPYENFHDGTWGIFDEPFFQYVSEKVGENKSTPFFATVFSLTSHHPYKLPDHLKHQFKDGPLPILKTIAYTDYALAQFMKTAEKQSWFKNTLFIFTADHTALHYKPEYEGEASHYLVPLIFYHPGYSWPALDLKEPVQHIDIMPSVLDFLNIQEPTSNWLATSVFKGGPKRVVNYIGGRYFQWDRDSFYIWSDPKKQMQKFSWQQGQKEEAVRITPQDQEAQNYFEAVTQYYAEGLLKNKLYRPKD